jgi:polysaccharide export outer membrane protein
VIYVHRQPVFYVYGEAQRPGSYRVERGMTFRQALAQAGGLSARGTERGLRVYRRGLDGRIEVLAPDLNDPVRPDDVVHVRESLF